MKLLSRVRLFIPPVRDIPPEMGKKWEERYYAQVRHISGRRRKAVGTVKDFQEKIAQPLKDMLPKMLRSNFVSRRGIPVKVILAMQRKSLEKAGRKYLKGLDQAYRTVNGVKAKAIKDNLALSGLSYARGMARLWTLIGRSPTGAKGPVVLAQLWLTGEKRIRDFLSQEDRVLKGESILITKPTRIKAFKNQLNRRLIRAGTIILKFLEAEMPPEPDLTQENDQINALVQQFSRPEFAPFSKSGDSHLDFMVKEISDPKNLTRTIKQLYLDIQVSSRMRLPK